jgi:cytochrome b561
MLNIATATARPDRRLARLPGANDAALIALTDARLRAEAAPANNVAPPTQTFTPAYTITARILHWVTALVILLMIPLGAIIGNDWGGPLQDWCYALHESLGTLLIPVMIGRLVYRLANPPLPLPGDIPALQQFAAHATHVGLYALLLAQPLVGWIAKSAYGAPIVVLGLFTLPPIAPENRPLSDQLFLVHGAMGFTITGLVAAHIGAALYHHLIRKDRVLMRVIKA